MKVGISLLLWTGHFREEHFPLLETIKAIGFHGVEVPLLEPNSEECKHLLQALQGAGLEATAFTQLPDSSHSAVSPSMIHRQKATDFLKHAIECAHILGSPVLCGPYHQDLGSFTGEPPTDTERHVAAEVHRAAAETANAANLILALEPVNRYEGYFLNTMAETADYVGLVDHPNFRATFDSFHANIEEKDSIVAYADHASVISHVHLSENDRGIPGSGQARLRKLLHALRYLKYPSWITIEAFTHEVPEISTTSHTWHKTFNLPEEVLHQGFNFVKNSLSEPLMTAS